MALPVHIRVILQNVVDARAGRQTELQRRALRPFEGSMGRFVRDRVIYNGDGSLGQQVRRRTHFRRQGGQSPWRRPAYLGNRADPPRVRAGERIMTDAAAGRGPAAFSTIRPTEITVGVDDRIIRQQAAALGNQIVSTAPYFPDVFGGYDHKVGSFLARASKPSRRVRRGPGRFAMWGLLFLSYRLFFTEAELLAGLVTPIKNVGPNPVMRSRMASAIASYIATGQARVRSSA